MPRGGVGGVPLGTERRGWKLGEPAVGGPRSGAASSLRVEGSRVVPTRGRGWHQLVPGSPPPCAPSGRCGRAAVLRRPRWGSCWCSLNPKAALASSRPLSLPGCAFSLPTWRSRAAEPRPAPPAPPDPLLALGGRQPGLGRSQLLLFIHLIARLSKTWARQTLLSSHPLPVPVSTLGGFPCLVLTMVVATLGAHLPRRAPCPGSGCAAAG